MFCTELTGCTHIIALCALSLLLSIISVLFCIKSRMGRTRKGYIPKRKSSCGTPMHEVRRMRKEAAAKQPKLTEDTASRRKLISQCSPTYSVFSGGMVGHLLIHVLQLNAALEFFKDHFEYVTVYVCKNAMGNVLEQWPVILLRPPALLYMCVAGSPRHHTEQTLAEATQPPMK